MCIASWRPNDTAGLRGVLRPGLGRCSVQVMRVCQAHLLPVPPVRGKLGPVCHTRLSLPLSATDTAA